MTFRNHTCAKRICREFIRRSPAGRAGPDQGRPPDQVGRVDGADGWCAPDQDARFRPFEPIADWLVSWVVLVPVVAGTGVALVRERRGSPAHVLGDGQAEVVEEGAVSLGGNGLANY